jgi:entericidin B
VIKRLIGLALLAAFLGGCNTMSGVGKDIERGGEKVQDTSKDVQRKM